MAPPSPNSGYTASPYNTRTEISGVAFRVITASICHSGSPTDIDPGWSDQEVLQLVPFLTLYEGAKGEYFLLSFLALRMEMTGF